MWLNVILAIDERLDDVKRCAESLRKIYGPNTIIALATYGGAVIGEQLKVKQYAAEQGMRYYDAPRHTWLTEDDAKEWHCCEALARMQITRHFAVTGFEEIYIMHADVVILGDFRSQFRTLMGPDVSFISIMLRAKETFHNLCEKGSWTLYFEKNSARLSDILIAYNPAFVDAVYAEYGNDQCVWDKWLSRFMLWSDLAQFDMAKNWNGFKGWAISEPDDSEPLCRGTIFHDSRQTVPAGVENNTMNGKDMDIMTRNFNRRFV